MKKIFIIVPLFFMYCFFISCSSNPDFSETVILIDNPEGEGEGEGDGEGEGEGEGDGEGDGEGEGEGGGPDPDGDGTPGADCTGGFSGSYPCENYDLVSWMSTSEFGTNTANDCWGWTDPLDNKEYAIYGLSNGTAFIDISDPSNPDYIAEVEGADSPWRDIKVYNNHAFIVSEANGYGMQVIDLTQLRDAGGGELLFPITTYTGFGSAHNIVINEETGFAYVVGSNTYGGGAHFVNIQDPANPIEAGGFSGAGYSHDAQVINYNGPDTDYTGHEIYIGSNETEVVIVDVTDKAYPQLISSVGYSNTGYTHQGWLTENHTYFIAGDESDELDFGNNTKTLIFDLTDLDSPLFHFQHLASNSSIDHNGYVKGNTYYLASYTAGLRTFDISDLENQVMIENGYFDVHPSDNNANFDGAWSVYPYFASGNIVISDMHSGLFIVKKQQ